MHSPTDRSSPVAERRVALVGAGFIARVHLAALARLPAVAVVAVCDPLRERAEALAHAAGKGVRVHGSVAELIAAGGVDAAHVLVPPDRHAEVAGALLAAGIDVLVEKPLALAAADARALAALAAQRRCRLGVNHNMVFQPGLVRLLRDLEAGRLGRLEHVSYVHWVPLRQLDSGDVGHFMLRAPASILLEQGVHPLSVIHRLLGAHRGVTVRAEPPRRLGNGAPFVERWSIALACERGTAQLLLGFGRTWSEQSLLALGSDGAARVDFGRGTYLRQRKTRWLEAFDTAANGIHAGRALIRQGLTSALRYGLGLLGIDPLPDDYLKSQAGAIASFHAAARAGRDPPCGAGDAEQVLATVEAIAAAAHLPPAPAIWRPAPLTCVRRDEVVVTGGTGFLGRHLVPALRAAGYPVTLLVRSPGTLPQALRDPELRIVAGDARDAGAMRRAAEGARFLVHMATCAAGPGESMEDAMRAGVRAAGEAALACGVQRLVLVSSIAALYLGDDVTLRGDAPLDPRPGKRSPYARGKIAAEQELVRLAGERGLGAVVLRPAFVVGAGGLWAHGGVGLWVRDNVCVGWGMGTVPLPFVLARDVAAAIVKSLTAAGAGGKAYNLAGPVRWTAPRYLAALREATGRDLRFHAQPIWSIVAIEAAKVLVKMVARRPWEAPSRRDFRSRGAFAWLDCSDAERDLGFAPERDEARFWAEAIAVHAVPPPRWTPAEAVPEPVHAR